MRRYKLGKRHLLISALAGLALFIGASTSNAAWFYRSMRMQPTVQAPAQARVVRAQSGYYNAQNGWSYRSNRARYYYPQSSQQLYHNLGKWPPYH